ncbi:MAG: hypothetical protein H7A25_22920 [Leptospiraceae bacterium]|nr:hypothetical protein [Leptospiraceae bacterium]
MDFFNFLKKDDIFALESKDNRKALTTEWKKKGLSKDKFAFLTAKQYEILFGTEEKTKETLSHIEIIILSQCDREEAEKLKNIHSKMSTLELLRSLQNTAIKVAMERGLQ